MKSGLEGRVFRKPQAGTDFVEMRVVKTLDGHSDDYLVTQTTHPGTSSVPASFKRRPTRAPTPVPVLQCLKLTLL